MSAKEKTRSKRGRKGVKPLVFMFMWWLFSCHYFAAGAISNGIVDTDSVAIVESISSARVNDGNLTICGNWRYGPSGDTRAGDFGLRLAIPSQNAEASQVLYVSAISAAAECKDLIANVLVQTAPDSVGWDHWKGLGDYLQKNKSLTLGEQGAVLFSSHANDLVFVSAESQKYALIKITVPLFESFKVVPSELVLLPLCMLIDGVVGPFEWILYAAGKQHGQPYAPVWIIITILILGSAVFLPLIWLARGSTWVEEVSDEKRPGEI